MNIPRIHPALRAAVILLGSCSLLCGQEKDDPGFDKKTRPDKEEPQQKAEGKEREDRKEGKDRREGVEDKLAGMKKKLEMLQREGRYEEAERLRHELAGAWSAMQGKRSENRGYGKVAEGPDRLRHLEEALRHLRAAGLDDPVQHLESVAKQMRAELSEQRERSEAPELKSRREKEGGDRRDRDDDIRAQLQNLARQVEELRAQVSKLQGGNRQ